MTETSYLISHSCQRSS